MMCISGGSSSLLLDLLYLACESTFGHYGSLYHFMLAWIILFDPPLYMGMTMLKGTWKYVGILAHKSVGMVGNKLVLAGK